MPWKSGTTAIACLLLFLWGLAGQAQSWQSISSVSLRARREEYGEVSGILETNYNGMWLAAARRLDGIALSHSVGNVLCRSLGYGLYQRSHFEGNQYPGGINTNTYAVNIDTIVCYGSEPTIEKCMYTPPGYNEWLPSRGELRIYCVEPKCNKSNGGCNQVCNDNPIASTEKCSCFPGFQLHQLNRSLCIDINECSVNISRCTQGCFNTIGSYICSCPTYMAWNETARLCTEQGLRVHCDNDRMQVAFHKKDYPMLFVGGVSLLDESCLPDDNGTHIIFKTLYESCKTTRSDDARGIIYSNSVVNIERASDREAIKFSTETKIQFSCVISKKSATALKLKTRPVMYATNPEGHGPVEFSTRLCLDAACKADLASTLAKESYTLYALLEMHTQDFDMSFSVKKCFVYPEIHQVSHSLNSLSKTLIQNGTPAADWVKVLERLDRTKYQFQFPAFNFVDSEMPLALECHLQLFTSDALRTSTPSTGHDINQNTTVSIAAAPNASIPSSLTTNPTTTTDSATIEKLISSCGEVTSDGMYKLVFGSQVVNVWCDVSSNDGPWLVIMRRNNGRLNFKRTWLEYENGFGNLEEEFWFGNALLYNITRNQKVSLRIALTTFKNATAFADYSDVEVGSAASGYSLKLGAYNGTAGDIRNMSGCLDGANLTEPIMFSTHDKDNDGIWHRNCAERGGGWWYYDCSCTCLTCGPSTTRQVLSKVGMIYHQFNQFYVLKDAELKIKVGPHYKAAELPNTFKVTLAGSKVSCSSTGMMISLDKEVYDQPFMSFGSFIVQSDSFVSQRTNGTHALLNFNLRAMDTIRQENQTTVSYSKRVAVIPSSNLTYYSGIEIASKCYFDKSAVVKTTYHVISDSVKIDAAAKGTYQVRLAMFRDEDYKETVADASTLPEGQPLYVKAVAVQEKSDLKLAITSCHLGRDGEEFSNDYQLVRDRCPLSNDVHILTRDSFYMRVASFMRRAPGTRVYCDIQVCAEDGESCDDVCNRGLRRRRGFKRLDVISSLTASSVTLS